MKKLLFTFVLCTGLVWSAYAQDMVEAKRGTRFGLGVSLGSEAGMFDIDFNDQLYWTPTISFPAVYVPIQTSGSFRLEPSFGLIRWHASTEFQGSSTSYTISGFRVGLGAFMTSQTNDFMLYYGLRGGVTKTKGTFESDTNSESDSKTDLHIGPAVGGEFVFGDHLGVGGEAGLEYTSYGDFEEDQPSDVETSLSSIGTRTLFFVRWYF